MTRNQVIRLAALAHLTGLEQSGILENFEHFAALVAAHEREECARFLESGIDLAGLAGDPAMQKYAVELLMGCAKAIRARGQG